MGSVHKAYVIRRVGGVPGNPAHGIIVPRHIVDVVPAGSMFAPELTEDGILYRFVGRANPTVAVPTWTRNGGNDE